jgi:hypothetical protein
MGKSRGVELKKYKALERVTVKKVKKRGAVLLQRSGHGRGRSRG